MILAHLHADKFLYNGQRAEGTRQPRTNDSQPESVSKRNKAVTAKNISHAHLNQRKPTEAQNQQ